MRNTEGCFDCCVPGGDSEVRKLRKGHLCDTWLGGLASLGDLSAHEQGHGLSSGELRSLAAMLAASAHLLPLPAAPTQQLRTSGAEEEQGAAQITLLGTAITFSSSVSRVPYMWNTCGSGLRGSPAYFREICNGFVSSACPEATSSQSTGFSHSC